VNHKDAGERKSLPGKFSQRRGEGGKCCISNPCHSRHAFDFESATEPKSKFAESLLLSSKSECPTL
jgi:hypothetical protein